MADIATRPTLRLRSSEQRALLVIGDSVVAILAFLGGVYIWAAGDRWLDFSLEFFRARVPLWFYLLPFFWLLMMTDLYDLHRASNWRTSYRGIALAALAGLVVYALIYFTSDKDSPLNRRGFSSFLILVSLMTLGWRWLYIQIYTSPGFMRRFFIVGAGVNGRTLVHVYRDVNPPPFNIIGFIDDDPDKLGESIDGYRVVGDSTQLLKLIEKYNISDLTISISGEISGTMFQTLLDAQEGGIEITPMPTLYEELLGRVPIRHLESDWVIRSFVDQVHSNAFYEIGKRLLDIVGSIVGMVIFLVLTPFISLSILLNDGSPVFYSQVRLGRGANTFKIYKFRTMIKDAEVDGQARPADENDPRVTKVGNILRTTRLDELPQFWNVLRGEMSLVGPRAERPELVEKYQKQVPFYRARLLVKPGITGWAQVNYGYAATVEDTIIKIEYDLYYIKHRTLPMDVVILLRTFGTVVSHQGR